MKNELELSQAENGAPTRHTPGPWVATTDGLISAPTPTLFRLRVAKAALIPNADAHGGFTGDEVTAANELLLAAAPDLLAALKRIVALSAGYPLLQAEMDIPLADAAIAKAEGR